VWWSGGRSVRSGDLFRGLDARRFDFCERAVDPAGPRRQPSWNLRGDFGTHLNRFRLIGDGVFSGPAGASGVAQDRAVTRTRAHRGVIVAGAAALAAAASGIDLADDILERQRLHASQLTQEREE